MEEEAEVTELGAPGTPGVPGAEAAGAAGVDPLGVALALGGASREKADAFLDDQRAFLVKQGDLIGDQRHYVHERYKQLVEQVEETWLRIWALRLGLLLRLATAAVGLVAAGGIALMVWYASHANGLLIEPFSVPPDMTSRGLTGQVVASQLLDKLTAMQDATSSARAAQSYANNWGDDIKVEIPETGVSVGELKRSLRGWLGHDTHISGDIYRIGSDIAITARAGGESGETSTGSEAELDALVQKLAEHVYEATQPYRYGNYIRAHGRVPEALAIYNRLTQDPSALENAWAFSGLATTAWSIKGSLREGRKYDYRAVEAYSGFIPAYENLTDVETYLGHNEAALTAGQTAKRLLIPDSNSVMETRSIIPTRLYTGVLIAILLGDYNGAVSTARTGVKTPNRWTSQEAFGEQVVQALALSHDGNGARTYLHELVSPVPNDIGFRSLVKLQMDASLEDWQSVLASGEAEQAIFAKYSSGLDIATFVGTQFRPWLALAKARTGDIAGARAMIDRTAVDCYDCIRVRGAIAATAKHWGVADYWFARAVRDNPSIPLAYCNWGQSLLARGMPDKAIEKFKVSNQKGPDFADPLEGWGAALMAKNRSDLALAKFAQAEKYAPNWGRLHLKWGEALGYAGRGDEAKAEYQKASTLYLTADDKAELARQTHHA